jgi:hypothetical protein
MEKTTIYIATPTLGNIRIETAQMISRIVSKRHESYDVIWPESPIRQPLDAARNRHVKKFMEISNSPDDRLLFIDDDIVPPLDVVERLAGHDKDIVGATCFVMKSLEGKYFPYPVALKYNEENKFVVHYGKGLERINGTGGGCIMIKRKVFEQMNRPYEYKYYPNGELELVADFVFCQKAEALGFELWYDFDCICDHIKPVSLRGINKLLLEVKNGR